jgi:hypothetical protein
MADNTLSTWAPFLYELKGKVVEIFPSEAPFLAEMSGYDAKQGMVDHASAVKRIDKEMPGGREIFSGSSVRHTLILAGLQAGGNPTESSTWNAPVSLTSAKVNLNLVHCLVPFSVSVDVERDSFDNSGASAVATLVQQARTALARLENFEMLGDGTGLIAPIPLSCLVPWTGNPGWPERQLLIPAPNTLLVGIPDLSPRLQDHQRLPPQDRLGAGSSGNDHGGYKHRGLRR